MGAGHHHAIGGERIETVLVQILVRDHVEIEALMLEPVGQVRVGVELPEAGAAPPTQELYFGRMLRIGRRREE